MSLDETTTKETAMGKFKSAMRTFGQVVDAMYERDQKVKELTQKLLNKTYGVDYDQAEKIARVLLDHAEITWK